MKIQNKNNRKKNIVGGAVVAVVGAAMIPYVNEMGPPGNDV